MPENEAPAKVETTLGMLDSPLFSRLGAATPFYVLDNIGRYTRFVGVAKLALLLAALGLILMVSTIMIMNSTARDKVRVVFSNVHTGGSERPIMLTPRFEGTDANDQPYSITAVQAAQTKLNGQDYIQMQSINADLTLKDGGWINLRAKNGVLSSKQKLLRLEGDVTLYNDQGYQMRTPQSMVDMGAGTARGSDGVQGSGPAGTLKADNYMFNQKAQTAHFDGNVVVTLYQTHKDKNEPTGDGNAP